MAKTQTYATRPNALAEQLGVDGKRVRSFLRQTFARPAEAKNSAWDLNAEQVAAVVSKFKK